MSLWENGDDNPERLWRIKKTNQLRCARAERKSVLWIERMLSWHVKNNQEQYDQLLSQLFIKYKSHIYEQFGWKHIQLNLEQAHEYQQIVHVLHWQIELTQKYFRKHKNVLLFPNSKDRKTYREQFWIPTAMVHLLGLQMTSTCVKRQQLHVKNCKVYHIHEIESLGQLASAIFNNGRFFIQEPLSKQEWLYCSGWDKSVEGLVQSGCLGITRHYHGKYSSLLQTLTEENVAENEANYREINNNWSKRELTNQMLKFPNIIIIALTKRNDDDEIISQFVQSCVMSLDIESQHSANEQYHYQLSQIASPAVETLNITLNQMQHALNVDNNATVTQIYWQNRSKMFNLNAFMAVSLPNGFNGETNINQINMSMIQANSEADKLLREAKNKQHRFKSQLSQSQSKQQSDDNHQLNANDNSNSNDNTIDNMSDDPDISILSQHGKARYNFRQRKSRYSNDNNNDNSNDINCNNYDTNASSASEFDINAEKRYYNSDGDFVARSNYNSESSDADNVDYHVLHPLHRWNWNAGSRLNRMAESDWLWRRKHCTASSLQGNRLYFLSFDTISTHIWNCELPMHKTTQIADTLSIDTLFDQTNGIKHIYLTHDWIPNYNANNLPLNCLFGITVQDLLIGLLQLHVTVQQHRQLDHLGNNNGRKCIIWQRCRFTDYIDLSEVTLNEENDCKYVDISTDYDILDEIGSKKVNYDSTIDHLIQCFRANLAEFIQLDNSAKNMVAGITKATGSKPCSTCEASGEQIYAFPTPLTMCFKTRDQMETVSRALNISPKEKHNQGCKEPPIWDCPVHRYGATTLHDYEGIFKVILDCFKGYLNAHTNGDALLVTLQDHNQELHNLYVEMTKLQDSHQFLSEQKPYTAEIQAQMNNLKPQIRAIQYQYQQLQQQWDQELKNAENSPLQRYLQILSNHKINEYYCLAGSVQGIMCKRICEARKEFVIVAKDVNKVAGILWELLFENINYLYLMLKRKYHHKYTDFEMASMKHAYIDFYHQLVLVVRSWKNKGDLTIKPHYLLHNVEHALHLRISPAFFDEERIENCHQHVKGMKRLYHSGSGNQHGCREMLVGRRMNDRVLSSG